MHDYNIENLRFLIIDDNRHAREVVRAMLNSLGAHQIEESGDGIEALSALKTFPPDIILCDLLMTPMDGIDFTHLVRTSPKIENPMVPIIILSGHADKEHVMAARDAGANEFLVKPVSTKTLYGHICEIIAHPRRFVQSVDFLGPDRRRHDDLNFAGEERRVDAPRLLKRHRDALLEE
ncbi:MAG: response regulator [Alphaproteobacteria bacterium]|nr:response regulator [Alphaproteobacteria bacterium]MBF0249867.1 response regulator [Alphaproteobacteria bacterium]